MRKKIISTSNYQGIDRRKEENMRMIKPFLIPALILVMSIGGYKVVISQNKENIKENTEKIEVLKTDTITLKAQLPAMKEDISDIKTCQQTIQTDIKEILKGIAKLNFNR